MNARVFILAALLGVGILTAVLLGVARVETPLDASLAPVFQLLGEPAHGVSRLLTKTLPVDDLDEAELGEALRVRYAANADENDPDYRYVNDLLNNMKHLTERPFDYQAYVIEDRRPNAMALPGGVVLITRGLLGTLHSEAELVGVLAHELGHIEQGHCFETVRFELLAQNLGVEELGMIADLAVTIMTAHSYSKNAEDEADEYAYRLLLASDYDPRGVAWAFQSLLDYQAAEGVSESGSSIDLMRDYFASHPPLELRAAKFLAQADSWWRRNPDEQRYLGVANLVDRTSYFSGRVEACEWMVAP